MIERGKLLRFARRVEWQTLPSSDNLFENESDFILNFVKENSPAFNALYCENSQKDPENPVNEAPLKNHENFSPNLRESKNPADELGPDRLPSVESRMHFEKAVAEVEKISPELAQTLRDTERLYIKRDPDEPFKFMNVPPVKLPKKKDCPTFLAPQYAKTFTADERAAVEMYIRQGLQSGMLEENSDSPYASPIILVKKKPDPNDPEGKIRLRFCTDNRRCNRLVLENVVFPAASMDASVREAGTGTWFTTFDISNAYHTVPLAEESRPITAFIYNGSGEFAGVYQYRNLNQGGALSPQLFVNTVRKALGPIFRDLTIVYHIDDFMISSETLKQHVTDVTKFSHAALRIDMSFDIKNAVIKRKRLIGVDSGFPEVHIGYRYSV